jgi:hypothetical protein
VDSKHHYPGLSSGNCFLDVLVLMILLMSSLKSMSLSLGIKKPPRWAVLVFIVSASSQKTQKAHRLVVGGFFPFFADVLLTHDCSFV